MTELERALRIIETQQKRIEELEKEAEGWKAFKETLKKIEEMTKQIQPWPPQPMPIVPLTPPERDPYPYISPRKPSPWEVVPNEMYWQSWRTYPIYET